MKENEFYIKIGGNIASIRKERKLTQDKLADEVGRSRASIVNIEKGRQRPTAFLIWQIATFFQVTIEDIFPVVESTKSLSKDRLIQQLDTTKDIDDKSKSHLTDFLKKI